MLLVAGHEGTPFNELDVAEGEVGDSGGARITATPAGANVGGPGDDAQLKAGTSSSPGWARLQVPPCRVANDQCAVRRWGRPALGYGSFDAAWL